MEFAEREMLEGPEIDGYLSSCLAPYKNEQIDAAVLGCTHYVFLKKAIRKALPGVPLVDGNDGTARRLEFLLRERNLLRTEGEGEITFMTSGDETTYIPLMKRLFQVEI